MDASSIRSNVSFKYPSPVVATCRIISVWKKCSSNELPPEGSYHSKSFWKECEISKLRPRQITNSSPIMQVDGFPVWVIAWVKRAAVFIELVGKYQGPLIVRIPIWLFRVCRLGCVTIYETPISRKIGDLPTAIDPAKVEPSHSCLWRGDKVGDDGEA